MDEAVRADPGAGRDRDPQVLQRPGVVHAGQPVPAGRGARAARLLRRRRLQLGRHRVGGRRRPGAGRVDRRGRADHRPGRRRRPPVRAVPRRQRVAARPGGRDPRPALRRAVAQPRARDRAATSGCRRCTTGWPRPGRSSAPGWAGSGRTSSRRRPAPTSTTPGAGRPGCPGPRPSSAPCRDGGRGLRPDVVLASTSSPARDALAALQWVCAADVDVPVGHCVYTPLLNARGTYEADLTVTRDRAGLASCRLSSATTVRDLDWLRRHLTAGVEVGDVTDAYAVLGVMGPALARRCWRGSTDADWSEDGFPFATSRRSTRRGRRRSGRPG